METLNMGMMKKRVQVPTGEQKQQIAPQQKQSIVSQTAQRTATDNKFTNGKNAQQGHYGINQGAEGQKAYNKQQGYDQINPIISSLNSTPSYTMPKITDKLTTQDGFNQALQVVGATNRAKIGMANRKVQGGVLGSLLGARSQEYGADQRANASAMSDQTTRRGQDINEMLGWKKQENVLAGQNIQRDHYADANAQATERNAISREQMEFNTTDSEEDTTIKDMVQRQKVTSQPDFLLQTYGKDIYDSLSDEQKADALGRANRGEEIPDYKYVEGEYWGGSFEESGTRDPYKPQARSKQSPQQQATEPQSTGITGGMLKQIEGKTGAKRSTFTLADDNSSVTFDDGSTLTAEEVQSFIGGV